MSETPAPPLFPEPPSTLAPRSSTPAEEAAVVRAARAFVAGFGGFLRPADQQLLVALDRALRIADEAALIPGGSTHYGCRVVDLGEDGEEWAIAGHVDRRLALSVVRRHLREQIGDLDSRYDDGLAEVTLARQWIVADYSRHEDDEVWQLVEETAPGARPVTFVTL